MQSYSISRYHINRSKLLIMPKPNNNKNSSSVSQLESLVDFIINIFKGISTQNRLSIESRQKIKPILLYRYERPELCALRYPKTKNIELHLTRSKVLHRFTRTTKKCFKGAQKVEFLHDKIRPTHLNVKKLPIDNLMKIHWIFLRRHSMTHPILEREFCEILTSLKKATKLKHLNLEFSGGHENGKPNYTTLFTNLPLIHTLYLFKPLESLTLYFRRSSGIIFSLQAFQQLTEAISYLTGLHNLSLDVEINPNEAFALSDQTNISGCLRNLKKLKTLRLCLQNIEMMPNAYCELWSTIGTLKQLEFIMVEIPIRDSICFESYANTILGLSKLKRLYLTGDEFALIDSIRFQTFLRKLQAKANSDIIFNLFDMDWFRQSALKSIKDLLITNKSDEFDFNSTSLAIDNEVFISIGKSIKEQKKLRAFRLSLLCCEVSLQAVSKFLEYICLQKETLKSFDLSLSGLNRSSTLSSIFSNISQLRKVRELRLDFSGLQREDCYWVQDLNKTLKSLSRLKIVSFDFSKILFTQNFMTSLSEVLEHLGKVRIFTLELEKEYLETTQEHRKRDSFLDALIAKLYCLKSVTELTLNLKGWESELVYSSVLLIKNIRVLKQLRKLTIYVSFMFNGNILNKFCNFVEKNAPKVSLFLTDKI